jgi:hypothetical protein
MSGLRPTPEKRRAAPRLERTVIAHTADPSAAMTADAAETNSKGGATPRPPGAARTATVEVGTAKTPASRPGAGPAPWEGSNCHELLSDPTAARHRNPRRPPRAAPAPHLALNGEPGMTLIATTPRSHPVTHAYIVPVVRELEPKRPDLAGGSGW